MRLLLGVQIKRPAYHRKETWAGVLLLEVLVLITPSGRRFHKSGTSQLTGNLSPYIEKEPVPSPLMKSPPEFHPISYTAQIPRLDYIPCTMKLGTLPRL